MKKFISTLLAGTLLSTAFSAYAETAPQSSITNALTVVKQKVQIPSELTEFDSRTSSYSDEVSYSFNWQNEDGSSSLEIQSDDKGRISSYYTWKDYDESSDSARLSQFSKSDALALAEDFLKQITPEAFTADDTLVLSEENSRGTLRSTGTAYSFTFVRKHRGVEVSGNRAYVYVLAGKDGMYVRSASADYNYDAVFEAPDTFIDDPVSVYKAQYPAKLYYTKDYEKSEDGKKDVTKAVYKLDGYGAGYISAVTGEKVAEMEESANFATAEDAASQKAMASAGGGANSRLTPQEIDELNTVAGLKTADEIESYLRSLPELKMTDAITVKSSSVYKNGENYMISLYLSDEKDRFMHVYADAKTGEIKSLDNNAGYRHNYDFTVSDEQKAAAEKTALSFFKTVAPNLADGYEISETTSFVTAVNLSLYRTENGVPYLANNADITYDVEDEMITGYSVSYSDADFADPSEAVSADAAYDGLLAKYPLKQIYVQVSENDYKLCYVTGKPYTDIDAFTAEPLADGSGSGGKYTDISGHWCETAVTRLAEVGIYFEGDAFRPDQSITKGDLLTYFAAGVKDNGYIRYGLGEVVSDMKRLGVIGKNDENSDAPVSREDACVYLVRLAGYEKIARLSEIFTVHFADEAEISPEKLGYAAILSGFGVVSGNNGLLRPKDNLTRAEAAAMLYSFLLKN